MRKLLVMLSLAFVASGCDPSVIPSKETGDPRLKRFTSPEEVKAYLKQQVRASARPRGVFDFMPMPLMGDLAAAPGMEAGNGGLPPSFSLTNLQEPGVDESDRVKTDGQYLYVAAAGRLRIIKADPPEAMEEVGSLALGSYPDAIYLRDGRVVALAGRGFFWGGGGIIPLGMPGTAVAEPSRAAPGSASSEILPPVPYPDKTVVTIISVADPRSPTVESTLNYDADLVSSRMIGDRLHLVLVSYPDVPNPVERIDNTPIEDIIPDASVAVGGQVVRTADLVTWSNLFHPIDPDGYGMTTVVSFDIADPAGTTQSTGVLADAGVVYASTQALYATDTNYDYTGQLRETTDVHKFDLTGGSAQYVGSGAVDGRVLDQYSLSEHAGYIRVATTRSGTFSFEGVPSPSNNAVYVLGPDGGELKIAGKVEGIAPGEIIYSARFVGAKGFVVTFKTIDPLFTIDLSNPAAPVIVGQLKVPGYSTYIHPMDADHLLTIGKDAEDAGSFAWFKGVQLSVFDVSEFADPQLMDKEILGDRGTESEALYNPKAFNYYPPLEALAIPIQLAEGGGGTGFEYGQPTFNGVYVFQATPAAGLGVLGRLATAPADAWGMGWCRTVFIGQTLYAVTEDGVKAVPFDALNQDPWEVSFD